MSWDHDGQREARETIVMLEGRIGFLIDNAGFRTKDEQRRRIMQEIAREHVLIPKEMAHEWVNCNEDVESCTHHAEDRVHNVLCAGLEGDSRYVWRES
jgi:hypothetical protein